MLFFITNVVVFSKWINKACIIIFALQNGKVTVNDFMDTMMSDPGPHCLVWFPLLHRLTSVENGNILQRVVN